VYHLNSRQSIAAGSRLRATIRLSGTGSDLGSQVANLGSNTAATETQNYNTFSFGLFETTQSQSVEDGVLVFAPTDFLPYAGTPNTILASSDLVTYGFDAEGDFFIDFVAPPSQFDGVAAGTFAFYVQGVVETDYQLVFSTEGTVERTAPGRQNVFIETGGGSFNWLQASGATTTVTPFNVGVLGFAGAVQNGQNIADYVLGNLVQNLNSLYQNAGLDVVFSTNPADFEFQQFSTVYLTSTVDPTRTLYELFGARNTLRLQEVLGNGAATLGLTQPFGYSQRSDALNTDREDDAVVFVPSFSLSGFTRSQQDVDSFVDGLTGAVARRAGELMGARLTVNDTTGPSGTAIDPFAANSAEAPATGTSQFVIGNTSRRLSVSGDGIEDTNFFLGRQRALSLLSLGVGRR